MSPTEPVPGMLTEVAVLGKLVSETRKHQNLRQKDLADLANVSPGFLSDFENGKPTVELGKGLRVLEALGLEVEVTPRGSAQ